MATPAAATEPEQAPPAIEPAEPSSEPTSDEQTQEVVAQETEEPSEPPSEPVPSPSFDLSDEDVKFALEKHGGDANALARAWKETNNRAAEMARRLKELEQPKEQKPPQIDPARKEAPPSDGTPREIEEQAFAYVRQDRECQAWRGEYQKNNETLGKYAERAAQLDHQISRLEARLDAETFKGLGFEEKLDEFEIRGLKEKLYDLKAERRETLGSAEELSKRNTRLADAYDKRLGQYRDHLLESSTAATREREEQEEVERIATGLQAGWTKTLEPVFKELGVPADPKLRERLRKGAARSAMAHFQGKTNVPDSEIQEFLVQAIKEEVEDRKAWTQHSAKNYAQAKKADSKSPAPPAKAAVAPADPESSGRWQDILQARLDRARRGELTA